MKKFSFVFLLLILSACTKESELTLSVPESDYWTCEHIYSPAERSVSFKPDDIKFVTARNCPSIILRGGECPTYVKVTDLEGELNWFTENEWENYTCEIKQENPQ